MITRNNFSDFKLLSGTKTILAIATHLTGGNRLMPSQKSLLFSKFGFFPFKNEILNNYRCFGLLFSCE